MVMVRMLGMREMREMREGKEEGKGKGEKDGHEYAGRGHGARRCWVWYQED